MTIVRRSLFYFGVGSVIAGTICGAGFCLNLGRRLRNVDIERLRDLGALKLLDLDSVSGTFIRHLDFPRPTIVCVHGRSANPMEMFPFAERMFRDGFNVVLWHQAGRTVRYDDRGVEDILRVVRKVREDSFVDLRRVFVAGFSLGASMSIAAAANDRDHHIAAVVADSPYANLKRTAFHYLRVFGWIPAIIASPTAFVTFRVAELLHGIDFAKSNPSDWARHVQCPMLLIHGRNDWRIPPEDSDEIYAALSCPKELWLVNGAGHTGAFEKGPDEYVRRVQRFCETCAAPDRELRSERRPGPSWKTGRVGV